MRMITVYLPDSPAAPQAEYESALLQTIRNCDSESASIFVSFLSFFRPIQNAWFLELSTKLAMEKEIAQLREALVPFAKCADAIECTTTHECHDADQWAIGDLDHILKFSDLRRARAAIAPHPPEGKGE